MYAVQYAILVCLFLCKNTYVIFYVCRQKDTYLFNIRIRVCAIKVIFLAIDFQTFWRGFAARVDFKHTFTATILIQRSFRSKNASKKYNSAKSGVTSLQSITRGVIVRRSLALGNKLTTKLHKAASIIQRNWFICATLQDSISTENEADLIAQEEARILAEAEANAKEQVQLLNLSFPLFTQSANSNSQSSHDDDHELGSSLSSHKFHVSIASRNQNLFPNVLSSPLPEVIQIRNRKFISSNESSTNEFQSNGSITYSNFQSTKMCSSKSDVPNEKIKSN